jgi:hypothetical protein
MVINYFHIKKPHLFIAIFMVLLFSCDNSTNTNTASNAEVTVSNAAPPDTGKTDDKPKTDAEVALEAFKVAVDVTQDAIADKRKNDSIREAHREKMFAYQIGIEKTDKDDVFDTYKKLMDLNVTGLYVVKKSRKDYVLVKYDAKLEDELNQGLDAFRVQVASVETKVDVKNLMDFCGLKEMLKKGSNLTERKQDFEVPCLVCD